ncbi:hypothetical protein LPJ78_000353 [Coemansia sp. RSA 989]|nr:hypothetical protein LPJ78_000353 [Coemansia sp. RSA 989]
MSYSIKASEWHRDFKLSIFSESYVAREFGFHMNDIKPKGIDDSAPIPWIITHSDYEIGAVLTVEGYRARNLGKYAF